MSLSNGTTNNYVAITIGASSQTVVHMYYASLLLMNKVLSVINNYKQIIRHTQGCCRCMVSV